jgi:glutathione S-transferase
VNLSPFWEGRRPQVAETGHLARAHAEKHMRWLNDELATRLFIAGDRYTIADITAQCACVLGKHTGTPISAELGYLTQWFRCVSKRPSARA